jgi:hypothetical protein
VEVGRRDERRDGERDGEIGRFREKQGAVKRWKIDQRREEEMEKGWDRYGA